MSLNRHLFQQPKNILVLPFAFVNIAVSRDGRLAWLPHSEISIHVIIGNHSFMFLIIPRSLSLELL